LVKALAADLKLRETGKQELFRGPHHVLFWLFAIRLTVIARVDFPWWSVVYILPITNPHLNC
jgi:uncharacterized membrane protein (DUF106 family)